MIMVFEPLQISGRLAEQGSRYASELRQFSLQKRQLEGQEEERGFRLKALEEDMKRQEQQQRRQEKIGILAQEALSGNSEAGKQLLAADPDVGAKINSQIDQQRQQIGTGIVNALQQFGNVPAEMQEPLREQLINLGAKAYPEMLNEDAQQQLRSVPIDQFPNFALALASGKPLESQTKPRSGGGIVQLQSPSGDVVGIDTQDPAQRQRMTDFLSQGYTQVPSRQETGEPGSFTKSQAGKRQIDFEQYTTDVAQSANLINKIKDQVLDAGAQGIGAVGAAQRFVGQAAAQIGALADVSGIDLNPKNFNFDSYDQGKIQSSRIKSNLTRLSFLIAQSRNPGGRITERDVQAALNESGASQDPEQFLATLDEVYSGLQEDYDIRARAQGRTDVSFSGNVEPLLINRSQPAQGEGPPTVSTEEEYNALPQGAEFIGPDGGRYRK